MILHILHVPISLPREDHKPSGTYIVDLFNLLNQSHKVGLIHLHPRYLAKINKFPFIKIKGKLYYKNFPSNKEFLTKEKFYFKPISRRNSKNWVNDMYNLFIKYIEENGKPDLIHCHSGRGAGEVALKINRNFSIPYIVMEHNPVFLKGNLTSDEIKRLESVY